MTKTDENLFPKELSHVLKGILATIIVGSHLHYVTDIGIWNVFNKFGTSVVAMFFFISGYGLMTSLNKMGGVNYLKSFASKRLWGIVKPFAIITLLYMLVNWLFYNNVPDDILYNLYEKGRTPLPNSWFIFSLIYFYISFYFSLKYIRNKNTGIAIVFFLAISFIVWCIYKDYERAWWVCAFAFPSGMVYSQTKYKGLLNKWYMFVIILLIVFSTVYVNISYILPVAYIFIPVFILGLCNVSRFSIFVKQIYHKENPNLFIKISKRIFDFMSGISYELYLVHGAIITLLNSNKTIHSSDYLFSLTVFSSSVFFAYIFHKIFNIKLKIRRQ